MRLFKKITQKFIKKSTNKKNGNTPQKPKQGTSDTREKDIILSEPVPSSVSLCLEYVRKTISGALGLIIGEYSIFEGTMKAGVVFIDSLTDRGAISSKITEPLVKAKLEDKLDDESILAQIETRFLCIPQIQRVRSMGEIIKAVMRGDTVVFIDGIDTALVIFTRNPEGRGIERPDTEVTVLSSMDSFNEDIDSNCSMVIRRLPTHLLSAADYTVGSISGMSVKVFWMEGIAKKEVVEEVKKRIQKVCVDTVEGTGPLSEMIEDSPMSVFPKYLQTQRPDRTAKYLADGYIAILCSNSPFALVVPMLFSDNFKSMDDYSEQTVNAMYLRIIRYVSFFLSITVSALYIAAVAYNQAIVPPNLAQNISRGREGVPFSSILEMLIMTVAISIIQEASLRIPGTIGFFVGTLSAVVIGQAAVSAGYVSVSLIIVVAISAISSFAITNSGVLYTSRLLNYVMIIFASLFGMFGVYTGLGIIFWYLISLESFGIPYMYPFVPFDWQQIKDTVIRARLRDLRKRPSILMQNSVDKLYNKSVKGKSKKKQGVLA